MTRSPSPDRLDAMRVRLRSYFSEFVHALTAYTRPYKGRLGNEWLGLDTAKRTMMIRVGAGGFDAVVTERWLGEPIAFVKGEGEPGQVLRGKCRHVQKRNGNHVVYSAAVKRHRGAGQMALSVYDRHVIDIRLASPESTIGFMGLSYWGGLAHWEAPGRALDATRRKLGRPADPPWSLGYLSTVADESCLEGLDIDPILEARGVADAILSLAGLAPANPAARYRLAARELKHAVETGDERALQSLLEERPWILVHEGDFDEVLFQPTLEVVERLGSGEDTQHRIIPDAIFHLPDSESLLVEIEAGSKRLFTTRRETSYAMPAAPGAGAAFQIGNYQRHCDGPLGAQIRRRLGKPDSWAFQYLLVVGSRLQPDFDERSWNNLREHFGGGRITVRTWDFFIDRLERLAMVTDYRSGGPSTHDESITDSAPATDE